MDHPIFAIIIGISEFQSDPIEGLPAATRDAISFARALSNWGIPSSQISLFTDSNALNENLESVLNELSKVKAPFDLIFYYCGHGYRTRSDPPHSYLLFHDSHVNNDSVSNGLKLDSLISKFSQLHTTNTYLFFDACYLRLNAIINPKLQEELQGFPESKKSFFCILSSGIQASFEDIEGKFGYFTDALIKGLSKIRKIDLSPTTLIKEIEAEMLPLKVPIPEVYNIGLQKIHFLTSQLQSYIKEKQIYRPEIIAEIQDLLTYHRKQVLFITGNAGCGKSTLASQLESGAFQSYLISIASKTSNLMEELQLRLEELTIVEVKNSHNTLETCLTELEERIPHCLIMIDNIQVDHFEQLSQLVNVLKERRFWVILFSPPSYRQFISKHLRPYIIEYPIPPLDGKETQLFTQETDESAEFLQLISQGNPLNMKKALLNLDTQQPNHQNIQEVKKTLAAIYSSGLYINETLFINTFRLDPKTLTFLETCGLILQENGCWFPHDFLIDIVESEQLELDGKTTINYWCQQLNELPNHIEVAKSLILTIKCFGYEKHLDSYLSRAFNALFNYGKIEVSILLEGTSIYLSSSEFTQSTLLLAEILLEWGELNTAEKLLALPTDDKQLSIQAQVCQANLSWRKWDLSHTTSLTTKLLESLPLSSESLWCHFHRGIAYYFQGDWELAYADFSTIPKHTQHPKYIGWTKCMLGTIGGIRGIETKRAQDMIQSGIQLLMKNDDLYGAWVGWNNLGEINWKSGEYRSSAYYLQKALEIAKTVENPNMILETLRNQLQMKLRSQGPHSKEVGTLLDQLETSLTPSCEPFERMQLLNTLTTAYLYLKDFKQACIYLKQVIALTIKSKEYHIYTLGNLSLLFKAHGLNKKGEHFYQRAVELAQQGNNYLAIKQLAFDTNACFK